MSYLLFSFAVLILITFSMLTVIDLIGGLFGYDLKTIVKKLEDLE